MFAMQSTGPLCASLRGWHLHKRKCYELQIINLHSPVIDKYLYIQGITLVYSLNICLSGTGSGGT